MVDLSGSEPILQRILFGVNGGCTVTVYTNTVATTVATLGVMRY